MKFRFATRHGVLLIAAANLAVAVASLAIRAFAKLGPYCDTPETIFRFVTFPVLSIAGRVFLFLDITFWTGSAVVIPVFYALLVLNACAWGVIGVRLVIWFHRTFWIMPEHPVPHDEPNLKPSVRRCVVLHTILLFLLFLYLRLTMSWFFNHEFGNWGAGLPLSLRLLIDYTGFLYGMSFWYHIPVWLLLLWLDARAYRHLYVTKGQRAAKWWSRAVVMTIVTVFLFSVFAFAQALQLMLS